MIRHGLTILPALLWMASGCLSPDPDTTLVSPSPFTQGPSAANLTRVSFTPADTALASRVNSLGQNIIKANPQIAMRPIFRTIGAPQPEIFHRDTTEVDITEGLVKLCQSEGQLAAILCNELGKMVSEREALAVTHIRNPDRPPPLDVPVGNDNVGGTSDMTRLAEQVKFDHRPTPVTAGPPMPPDPTKLARSYLVRTQYAETELDNAAPLLSAAAANCTLEKQFTSTGPARPWTR